MKSNVYNQFWKQTSTSQHRLLSTFDSEKGKMQMAFLQAQIPFPKSPSDYKKNVFSFNANKIHPIDQMDMHRQSGEMLFSTMTTTTMSLSKLRTALANVQSRLKIEKISSLAKGNKVNALEDLVIKVGYDPKDVKAAELVLKKKDADIAALKKQLKLPSTEDPITKDIAQNEQQKEDMLKLIIDKNIQLKKMEEQVEELLKEKEAAQLVTVLVTTVPIAVAGTKPSSSSTTIEST